MPDLPKIQYLKKGWRKVVVHVIVVFLKIYCSTIRIKLSDDAKKLLTMLDSSTIFAFWHNKLFISCAMSKLLPRTIPIYGLVSPSKDGAVLSYLFHKFGIMSVRGSSKRRGLSAISKMAEILSKKAFVAITPDGPRGPLYKMKNGLAMTFKKSGCDVILVHIRYSISIKLPTWDKFEVPLPFTKAFLHAENFRANEFEKLDVAETTAVLEDHLKNQNF